MKLSARWAALSLVRDRLSAVAGSLISFFSSAMGRGVVVTTATGLVPRRSAICKFIQASSARGHFASSSHQAASNCGPRRPSGSAAENTCATVPLGQVRRRFDGSNFGRSSGW